MDQKEKKVKSVSQSYSGLKNDNINNNKNIVKLKTIYNNRYILMNNNYKKNGKISRKIYKLYNLKKKFNHPKNDLFTSNWATNISNLNDNIKNNYTENINEIKIKKNKNALSKSFNEKYYSNISNNNLNLNKNEERKRKKNTISYLDRNKIKKLNTMTLKLYEIYLQRKNQTFKTEESMMNDSIFNPKNNNYIMESFNEVENNNVMRKYKKKDLSINSSFISSQSFSSNFETKIKKKLKKFKTERKYGLKQLMEINPYHYVSGMVKYCNSVEMKQISEKLSNVNGASFNKKATYKPLFFINENTTNKDRIRKVVNLSSVSLNKNLAFKGGFVWRILSKISKSSGYSAFYHACKFKGYSELWRHYSIFIEQLLVKYPEFKWFLEKNKYMKEEVFKEFLTCMKLETKYDNSFTNKVFLLFDEESTGEINLKIFFFIMELTSKSSTDTEKINFYTELFTELKLKDEIKCINVLEMYDIIKNIIYSPNYKKECKFLYDMLKHEFNNGVKIESSLYISKQKLYLFFLNNKYLHRLMQGFLFQYRYADISYNEEINSSFNSTIRNVKKFLNQQNEINKASIYECNKFENVLKAVQNKDKIKNQLKNVENEFNDSLNSEKSFNIERK